MSKTPPLRDRPPLTANGAVRLLFTVHTNGGLIRPPSIDLLNPNMEQELYDLWRREQPGLLSGNEVAQGRLAGIGRWMLVRSTPNSCGALHLIYEEGESYVDSYTT
jgi:hypothetical protein